MNNDKKSKSKIKSNLGKESALKKEDAPVVPEKTQVELDLVKGMLARALADYDNLKRRSEEEKTSWAKFSSLSIVSKLLPILDMLESAQNHLKDSGLAIALGEFKKVFIEEGLEEIKPEAGTVFDENSQEVVEVVDGASNDTISEVIVPGWKFKDGSVVRHAKVKVFTSQR
jgi:molecular chaperone GrpE